MRLIDADALRAQCDAPHWCVWMSEIDDAPTIDAEPVKHGRWEECMVTHPSLYGLAFGWKCSRCGYDFEDRSKHRKKPIFMKYCPNCGAKMEVDDG